LLERTVDDLSDMELFSRLTDEGAFVNFCIDELRRLPSEVAPVLGCREWTLIQARAIVREAQSRVMRRFQNQKTIQP
jgi:hypothetical protein